MFAAKFRGGQTNYAHLSSEKYDNNTSRTTLLPIWKQFRNKVFKSRKLFEQKDERSKIAN